MLILRRDDVIPLILQLPPSSLKSAQKYFLRLASASLPYQAVVTQLRLRKVKSAGGNEYAEVEFSLGRQLEEAEVRHSMELAESLRSIFMQAPVTE
jgi:hypothetical protein